MVKNHTLSLVGLLLAFCILTDPLMVYPALVAFAALFLSGIGQDSSRRLWGGFGRILPSGIATALILGTYALCLVGTGTTQEFYRDTIWFNAEIYAKYENAKPNRISQIVQNLASGLNILDPKFIQQTSPLITLDTNRSISLADEIGYSTWIFSNFLFRLSIPACVAALILQHKATAGIFLYIFSAALLVRANTGLYTTGFTLVSLFAGMFLLVELRRPELLSKNVSDQGRAASFARNIALAAWFGLILVVGGMQFFAAFRGGSFLLDHWGALMDHRHVTMYEKLGDEIHTLTCNQTVYFAFLTSNKISLYNCNNLSQRWTSLFEQHQERQQTALKLWETNGGSDR